MKKYVASDFLTADINVKKINQIWKAESATWARPQKKPRDCDGLLYFISGAIRYDFGDFTFDAMPGQALKLPHGIPYSGVRLSNDVLKFYVIDFETAGASEFMDFPLPFSFTPSDTEQVKNMFAALEKKWSVPAPCNQLDCKRDFLDLFSFLTKDFANNICRYDVKIRIFKINEYIVQNACNPNFKIEDVAKKFHLSETHLRRIFEMEFGMSPMSYLCSVRLDRAKCMLLSQKDITIQDIAESCGYSSVYYFSNMFHKRIGVSPSEYRNAQKNRL